MGYLPYDNPTPVARHRNDSRNGTRPTRIRVENGGTNLGAITTAAITAPTPTPIPTSSPTVAAAPAIVVPTAMPTSGPIVVGGSPTSALPNYPGTTTGFAVPSTPTDTAPRSFTPPSSPTISTTPTPGTAPSLPDVAAAAAPFFAPISPVAGAAAAFIPAVANAASSGVTVPVRFDDDSDAEIYNADGTPVTPKAKTATFLETIKALPPAAKLGGAVVLYLLFSRRR